MDLNSVSIRDRVVAILKEIRPEEDFPNSDNFISDGMLDSFDLVLLIEALEKVFITKIQSADVRPEHFCDLEAITGLLEKYGVRDQLVCDGPTRNMQVADHHKALAKHSNAEGPGRAPELIKKELVKFVEGLGLANDCVMLIQADISEIFRMHCFNNKEGSLDFVLDCFREAVSPSGTFIVPTFNWEFCETGDFDHAKSRSQVGAFSNHVLSQRDAVRSLNPILSFAGVGPRVEELFSGLSRSCYGDNSVYQRLHSIGATMVFFNLYLRQANFVHYIEQQKGVAYRFLKEFSGRIRRNGLEWEDTYDLYVRKDMDDAWTDLRGLEARLYELGVVREILIADEFPVIAVNMVDFYNETWRMLEGHPSCLCAKEPLNAVVNNLKRPQPWNISIE
jgi:aminoglycoside 3-N-acetyltransferase